MSSRTRSEFGTIAQRTSGVPAPEAVPPEAVPPQAPPPQTSAPGPGATADGSSGSSVHFVGPRHVWVDGDHAGLLLAWRRAGAWQGRVFWCPPDTPEAVLDWIDQYRLRPAGPA